MPAYYFDSEYFLAVTKRGCLHFASYSKFPTGDFSVQYFPAVLITLFVFLCVAKTCCTHEIVHDPLDPPIRAYPMRIKEGDIPRTRALCEIQQPLHKAEFF